MDEKYFLVLVESFLFYLPVQAVHGFARIGRIQNNALGLCDLCDEAHFLYAGLCIPSPHITVGDVDMVFMASRIIPGDISEFIKNPLDFLNEIGPIHANVDADDVRGQPKDLFADDQTRLGAP